MANLWTKIGDVFKPASRSTDQAKTLTQAEVKASFQARAGSAPAGLFGSGLMSPMGGSVPYWMDNRNRGLASRLGLSGEKINYAAKVGEMTDNGAVLAGLMWIMRNYPSAPIKVRNRATKEVVKNHPLESLMAYPTRSYALSYSTLSAGICVSYFGHGNAYLFKVRDASRRVVELWYRPHWMVKPVRKKGSPNFIDHFEYSPDGFTGNSKPQEIDVSEVIHLRFGFDPKNEMIGMSPLRGLLETIYTEQESNAFLASVLTNLGVIGAVITHKPKLETTEDGTAEWYTLPDEEVKRIKQTYQEEFTGGKRGSLLFLDGEFEMQFPTPAFDSGLAERAKKIAQADIAAALGIPPAILGFLVGLEHQDARAAHESMLRQAYDSCLCPAQRDHAMDYSLQLLTDFEQPRLRSDGTRDAPVNEVYFDYSSVPAMQESQDQLWKRAKDAYQGGGITRAEYRQIIGFEPDDAFDKVYLVQKGSLLAPVDMDPAELTRLLGSGGAGPPDTENDQNDDDDGSNRRDDPPPGGKPPEKKPKPSGKGKETTS